MVQPSALSLCVHLAIAYLDPDIPVQQAVGVSHCRIKMVDDTDNQIKVENAENKTALCFTRHTYVS